METEAEFKQKYSSLTADQKLDAMYQMYLANNMDSTDVIDKYHGLSRIENQFEEMKGPLDTRPMYVHKSEHIYAHLLICMIALVMIRLIQRKYKQKYPPAKDDRRNWAYGLTGERVQTALQKWKAKQVGEDSYWFADIDDE